MHSLTSFMTSPEKWGGPNAPLSKSIAYPATETGDTDHPTDHPSAVRPWAGFGLADDSQPRIFSRVSEISSSHYGRTALGG
jgi:hypothetical protein